MYTTADADPVVYRDGVLVRDTSSRLHHRGDRGATTLPWQCQQSWFTQSGVNDHLEVTSNAFL